MNKIKFTGIVVIIFLLLPWALKAKKKYPLGVPGTTLAFRAATVSLPASVIKEFELILGPVSESNEAAYQWLLLKARKVNGQNFAVWVLSNSYPSADLSDAEKKINRYIFIKDDDKAIEYSHPRTGAPVLPGTGVWKYLFPQSESNFSPLSVKVKSVKYLGLKYVVISNEKATIPSPPSDPEVIHLTPDLMIGVPHNTKVKDETRRWDDSEYEYEPMTRENYREMIDAGMNCFYTTKEQRYWLDHEHVFYWGISGKDIEYPEDLYKSNYVGPVIFFDEPMVGTRDHVIRPMLRENPELAKTLTPQLVYDEFKKLFYEKKYNSGPARLITELAAREDVDTGDMNFLQQNVYSWETMISSAIYQLYEGNSSPPYAMVFEPPGRIGAKRVLPEWNMAFGCQIPIDEPNNFIDIIYGFLRGAARETGKTWGMSVYGQVARSDAFWFMTHAYDMGATLFFFWDNHRLAAVPYPEYLALSRNLKNHAENFPERKLENLKHTAKTAILLPEFYNLGHVSMGIGNFSALPALNMERKNSYDVKYRDVMRNFFTEIERCIRFGKEYDLFWNMKGLRLDGYEEIVIIREDGKVEIISDGISELLDKARVPVRPGGNPPELSVGITPCKIAPCYVTATAKVIEGSAPLYYTMGADSSGVYHNQYVLWELYGPGEEDHSKLWTERWNVKIKEFPRSAEVKINFTIDKPGAYHLRVATSDTEGKSAVVWKVINLN